MADQLKIKNIGNVVCSIIEQNGKFLIAQRPKEKSLALKWEFPGGKVNKNESEEEALKREIREELGIEIEVGQRLTPHFYRYSNFTVNLIPYRCRIISGKLTPHEHANIEWVDVESVWQYDLAAADGPIIQEYLSLIGGKQ